MGKPTVCQLEKPACAHTAPSTDVCTLVGADSAPIVLRIADAAVVPRRRRRDATVACLADTAKQIRHMLPYTTAILSAVNVVDFLCLKVILIQGR